MHADFTNESVPGGPYDEGGTPALALALRKARETALPGCNPLWTDNSTKINLAPELELHRLSGAVHSIGPHRGLFNRCMAVAV